MKAMETFLMDSKIWGSLIVYLEEYHKSQCKDLRNFDCTFHSTSTLFPIYTTFFGISKKNVPGECRYDEMVDQISIQCICYWMFSETFVTCTLRAFEYMCRDHGAIVHDTCHWIGM